MLGVQFGNSVCSRLILIPFRTCSFKSGGVFNCPAMRADDKCMYECESVGLGAWDVALPSPFLYQNVFLLLWPEPPPFLPAWAEILLLSVAATQGEDGEGLPRMFRVAA